MTGALPGRQPGGHALEWGPHLEDLREVADVDLADEHSPARDDRDEALHGQALQRLPDGCAPQGEALPQRVFGEHLTGGKAQRDDLLEQLPVGLLRLRRGRLVEEEKTRPVGLTRHVKAPCRGAASHVE